MQVNEIKNYLKELIETDNKDRWEFLINNNFFCSWSCLNSYLQTKVKLQNIKGQFFRFVLNLEEDLYIILYKSFKSQKLTLNDFFEKNHRIVYWELKIKIDLLESNSGLKSFWVRYPIICRKLSRINVLKTGNNCWT